MRRSDFIGLMGSPFGLAVTVGLAYFLAARLSLALITQPDGVAVFWPAAGVAAGVLISRGPSARLPVVAGVVCATLAANLLGDRNIWSTLVFAACNAGESLLVAGLLERFFGSPFRLDRLPRVFGFIAAALAATAISGIGGTLGYIFFHTSAPALTVWQNWFASDAIGIIAVAPLLIELVSERDAPTRREALEGGLALAMLAALSVTIISLLSAAWANEVIFALLLPLLLWMAARCRPVFGAAAAFLFAMVMVWTTTFGIGVFGDPDLPERVLFVQFSILTQALSALVLAALFAERRENVASLLESQERALRASKVAQEANRAKSSFLAAASHDLRQPLQTLNLLQAALQGRLHDNESRALLAGIERSTSVMNGMLVSLLDIDRLETGSLRASISDFPINDLFESVAADFSQVVTDKGLEWRLVRSNIWVQSDRRILEEMVRNLLSNAARYTDRGKILVGCRRHGGRACIEVWDSGVGIMGEEIPRIFEEHYQGSGSAQLGGFGLGLAIVQRLANILGHRVDVSSSPGRGSGFSIEVPFGNRLDLAEHSAGDRSENQSLSGTVLVIEDEGSVRRAFDSLLRSYGLQVTSAPTVDDALQLVGGGRPAPDLVLSDFNLPGKRNGVESVKALRAALGRQVPAIVVTGDTRKEVIEMITACGLGVAIKPVNAAELRRLMSRMLPH